MVLTFRDKSGTKLTYFFSPQNTFAFLLLPRIVPRALGSGARRRLAWTPTAPRRTPCVPAGLRGACSGRSKRRILANTYGDAIRPARAKQENGNPTVLKGFLCCWLLLLLLLLLLYLVCSHRPSNSLQRGSHGTAAVAHQSLPFVKVTDGAFVRACLRAWVCGQLFLST